MKKISFILIISFLMSACGVNIPADDDDLIDVDKIISIETPETTTTTPVITTAPLEIKPEPKQDGVIKNEFLEPFIIFSDGHSLLTGNYHIWVISFCGAVKDLEYVHENADERHNINMYRFANAIYEQMNDDSIPVVVQFDKVPNNIIEFVETVGTVDLDTNHYFGAENWMYYIITGTGEERRAEKIGSRWGSDGSRGSGSNELTIMINEYLENTERREP